MFRRKAFPKQPLKFAASFNHQGLLTNLRVAWGQTQIVCKPRKGARKQAFAFWARTQKLASRVNGLLQSWRKRTRRIPVEVEIWPWVKSQIVPVNIPIPTKIGSKINGWCTYPKMVPLVLTHGHIKMRMRTRAASGSCGAPSRGGKGKWPPARMTKEQPWLDRRRSFMTPTTRPSTRRPNEMSERAFE